MFNLESTQTHSADFLLITMLIFLEKQSIFIRTYLVVFSPRETLPYLR